LKSTQTRNELLEEEIVQLNREKDLLRGQIKEKDKMIGKLNSRFKVFEEYKPIFEEFFKEFPEGDPIKIIQGIKTKKETSIRIIEELDSHQKRILELEKEKKEYQREHKRIEEAMSNRITELEKEHHDKLDKYQKEIKDLQSQVAAIDYYKQENLKYHYMLFNLYNQLIERLRLEKNINIAKELLNVEEKDFKPDLFDNGEIIKYIKALLITSSEEMSSKVLREVIAYSNMMLRTYLKENYKESKFNPVQIFKDIHKHIEDLQTEKYNNQHFTKRLQDKLKELTIENKKLVRENKYQKIKFENIQKKLFKQFNERIEKSREIRNNQIMSRINKNEHILLSNENSADNANPYFVENTIRNVKEIKLDRPKTARNIIKQNITKNAVISGENSYLNTDNNYIGNSIEFNTYLTNQSAADTAISHPRKSESTRPQTGIRNRMILASGKIREKDVNQKKEEIRKNTIHRNIKSSKTKDNLEMKGKFPVYDNQTNERPDLRNLVDHTNKMFLLKDRLSNYSLKMDKRNENKYSRFIKKMEFSVNKINKVTSNVVKLNIDEKIMNNIDNIIKRLETN